MIEATTAVYPGYLKRIEIHGTEGSAVLEEEDLKVWDFAKPRKETKRFATPWQSPRAPPAGPATPRRSAITATPAQFQDFVDAIRKHRPPAIDGHEGRRSVEIILAIYKSAETGKAVALPLKSDPVLQDAASRRGSDSSGIAIKNRPPESAIAAPKTALPRSPVRCDNRRRPRPRLILDSRFRTPLERIPNRVATND